MSRISLFFLIASSLPPFAAPAFATKAPTPQPVCQRALAHEQEVMVDVEMMVEEILAPPQRGFDKDAFLKMFSLPPEYARSEAEFQAARARALETYLPLLETLMNELHQGETVQAKLRRLARAWAADADPNRRNLILAAAMKMFEIRIENEYMLFLANADCSAEFKATLARALREIFQNDTAWIAPLDHVMARAGVPY